jgi:hypothetical protein
MIKVISMTCKKSNAVYDDTWFEDLESSLFQKNIFNSSSFHHNLYLIFEWSWNFQTVSRVWFPVQFKWVRFQKILTRIQCLFYLLPLLYSLMVSSYIEFDYLLTYLVSSLWLLTRNSWIQNAISVIFLFIHYLCATATLQWYSVWLF